MRARVSLVQPPAVTVGRSIAPIFLVALASVTLSVSSDAGTIMKCVDKRGAVTYSDRAVADGIGSTCSTVSVSGNVAKTIAGKPATPPASVSAGSSSTTSTTSGDLQQDRPGISASPLAGGTSSSAGGGGGGATAGGGPKSGLQPAVSSSAGGSQSPSSSGSPVGRIPAGAVTAATPPVLPQAPSPPVAPVFGRYTTGAVPTITAESTRYNISSASVTQCNATTPTIVAPSVNVDDYGAKGDGVTDDTEAINKAIQSLSAGGTVVFTPGKTYMKRGSVVVARSGVKLWGYGAIIYSVITDADILTGKGGARIAIILAAPNTGVYGFTLISNLRARLVGHPNNAGIYLMSDSQEVVDNRFEYTGNGVLITGTGFLVTRNVVYRTWADGIAMTQDARAGLYAGEGRVLCNMVRENGDDMISIVNYGLGEPKISNILVEGNDVSDQYSGRGITVVGGKDITIRENAISYPTGAGILVNSEGSYQTSNVQNVLIDDNHITQVQIRVPNYNPINTTAQWPGQGAIDVNAQLSSQSISQVLIRNNLIDNAGKDGIFVRNHSKQIGLVDNTIRSVGRDGVRIETSEKNSTYCSGNILDGTLLATPQCAALPPTVTGSRL